MNKMKNITKNFQNNLNIFLIGNLFNLFNIKIIIL